MIFGIVSIIILITTFLSYALTNQKSPNNPAFLTSEIKSHGKIRWFISSTAIPFLFNGFKAYGEC